MYINMTRLKIIDKTKDFQYPVIRNGCAEYRTTTVDYVETNGVVEYIIRVQCQDDILDFLEWLMPQDFNIVEQKIIDKLND